MSVRHAENKGMDHMHGHFQSMTMDPAAIVAASQPEVEPITDLGEGSTGFQSISQRHPLERTVVVTIRASLADLTTNAGKAMWAPSAEQLGSIYQQKQFVDIHGNAEKQGELRSVVVHSIDAESINSTFPIALGCKISGVEEKTYSSIGAPYSYIALPNAKKDTPQKLQEDDVSVGTLPTAVFLAFPVPCVLKRVQYGTCLFL